MATEKVYGWWIVRDDNGVEIHRTAGHHPVGSTHQEKAEAGLLRRLDLDRYGVEWEDAQ